MQEVASEKVSVGKVSRLAGDDVDDNSDGVKDDDGDYDDGDDDDADDDDDDLPRLASSSDTRGVAARLLGGIGLSSILIVMTRMKMMMMTRMKMMMTLAMTMITSAMSSSFHTSTASCPSCHCPRR